MFQFLISAWIPTTVSVDFSYFSSVDQANATTTSIQALSISPVTNQTAAVFGNIANYPVSVQNNRYFLTLSALPEGFGNVFKF
jgi:hypothetical protein